MTRNLTLGQEITRIVFAAVEPNFDPRVSLEGFRGELLQERNIGVRRADQILQVLLGHEENLPRGNVERFAFGDMIRRICSINCTTDDFLHPVALKQKLLPRVPDLEERLAAINAALSLDAAQPERSAAAGLEDKRVALSSVEEVLVHVLGPHDPEARIVQIMRRLREVTPGGRG